MSQDLLYFIRVWCVAAGFIIFPAVGFSGAGDLNRARQFSPDLETRTKISQTHRILIASLYESRQSYEEAYEIWRSLPPNSRKVQNHLSFNRFLISGAIPHGPQPISKNLILLVSDFLVWSEDWESARDFINDALEKTPPDHKLLLKKVHIDLLSGLYTQAEKTLESIPAAATIDKIQIILYRYWLYLLTRRYSEAFLAYQQLHHNFLYLPLPFPLFDRLPDIQDDLREQSRKNLIRFPSENGMKAQYFDRLRDHQDWSEMHQILQSGPPVGWDLQAEILLQRHEYEKLEKLYAKRGTSLQKGLELQAKKAIKENNPGGLKMIATEMIEKFPASLDGSLFLTEYYRITAQPLQCVSLLHSITHEFGIQPLPAACYE